MKAILNYLGGYLKHVDKILPIICIGLSIFSVFLTKTMTYDAMEYAIQEKGSVNTQVAACVLGILAALAISLVNYKLISKLWFVYTPIALILQFLLFTPLAIKRDDDIAWLKFGAITIQPSEILKFAFILTLATHISWLGDRLNSPKHLIPVLAHGLFPVGLIIIQGDAGSALVFLFILICMLFMAGISWKYIVAGIAAVPPVLYVAWNYIMKPHHRNRVLILFDKEMQEQERRGGIFYQQYNGTVALGSGQLKGLGFDASNYTYIIEGRNDYIFSYIGMTLGFIGCMCVVIALAVMCLKLLSDASGAQDMLGKLICIGVFAMVFFHCVINLGMVLCVTPVVGIPLPFVSQGGTSMLMMHACMGLVLSVTAHREKPKHMFYTEKD